MTDLCSQAKDSRAGNDIFVPIDTALHPLAAAQLPTDEELAVSLDPIQSLPMTDSVASANSLSHVHSSWKDGEENLPDHDLAHRDPWSKVLAGTPGSFPLSLITPVTTDLTPEMLPLANLTQPDIDRIVEQTPGKVSNIQDIYPLLPLQDTLLHRLPGVKADPYLIISQIAFENKDLLDRYLQASQKVVDRHDILRTAFVWKDISTPPQVVWRHATIPIQELVLDPANGPAIKQLEQRFHPKHYRINLAQAPLMQCAIAQETDGRWMLLLLMHQLIGDRVASEMMNLEIEQILHGQESSLPIPWTSHNLFMQISEAATHEGHERFFKATLGDVENPTFPFGLSNTHTNGENITESSLALPQDLNDRLRFHAKQVGVTLASLCHVAWAQVVARTSGQDDVVFGTVLPGGQEWSNAMGPSTNTLPFRCDTDTKVRECIQRTQVQLEALLEHRGAPLSLAQRCSAVPSGTPLFTALFKYLNTLPSVGNIDGRWMMSPNQEGQMLYPGIEILGRLDRTNYPLAMTVEESGSATRMTVQAARPIDPSQVCGYMRQALESLVKALEAARDIPMSDLEVMPAQERQLLLQTLNETQQEYPAHLCIHHLFEQQVECTPEATAAVYMDQSITYSELNARANCLAHHLIRLGVQPDDPVAICVDRSIEMIIGVLAILKAGGAYVPLDPTYASERLRDILTDAAPRIVIADESGRMALGDAALSSTVVVDPSTRHDTEKQRDDHVNPQISELTSSHITYIIYTSGSTGKPKGVMVEHQGVVNLAQSRVDTYGVTSSSRIAQFFAFGFDGCALDIFMAACLGGSLHVLPNCIRADPGQLWSYLETHSITQVILPPAILHGCKDLPPLSTSLTLITAGEALAPGLLRTLQTLVPNGRIVNDYGPTEATVSAIAWKCPSQLFEGDVIPIGRPITNKRVYILNKHRQPVPSGVAGELYIGGVGVARGYLNRPDLTAQVFLPDPFVEEPGARMYKTGDMVRYLPDGNMIFLGRNDHQVKIRGFRIELGEIESRLSEHALVEETIVIATGEGSCKRLVAYVVANRDDSLVHTLRSYLSSCLPDYMVPAAIVRMDALPLTSNGKVDRKALPDLDSKAFARHDYEEPQGSIEISIAQIWAELLNIDRVSRNDNFFGLGGHSLLVVQLVERLRRIGLSVSISVLFKNPTLHALAQSIHRHLDTSVPGNLIKLDAATITPDMLPLVNLTQGEIDRVVSSVPRGVSNIKDIYALSPLQEGILFHHLLEKQGDPYLLVFYVTFESRQLLDRYLEAVQKVVDRHDIMRTALAWDNMTTPVQVVWRQAPLHISEVQLNAADGPIKDQMMSRFDSRHNRIDLSQAPLMRHAVSKDADGRWALVELIHHSIMDHTTIDMMRLEIAAIMEGRSDTLASPQPFRNFIAHVQSGDSQVNHKQFFTEMLSDIDIPSLPFGLTDVRGHGGNVSSHHRFLSQDLNNRLRKHAKALDVNVASLCHLAWAMVLSRTTGEDRAVFGTVLFGRMQSGPGSDSAMGLFINTLPVRVDVQGDIREAVLQTHDRLASLLDHEHASLVVAQQCSGVAQGTPLFGSILNYVYESTSRENTSIYPGVVHVEFKERTNYPITLSVEDYGASFGITADVVSPLDPSRISGYMEQVLQSLVEAIELTTEIDVCGLGVLPAEERELLMNTWNATDKEYPEDICIHHLFEQQAERTPEATALVFMDQSLTYRQLNERSNRLAHHLIGLGVRPDTLVAICVDRSIAMIVGVLAILKAGGAYVPLDPSYPTNRLVAILEDCHPSIVLADTVGRATFGEVNTLSEDHKNVDMKFIDPNDTFLSSRSNPVVPELTSLHISYIIYTSGSTGRPKGVMIEHQGVVNHTLSRFEGYDHSSRNELQFSSLNFDFSVLEIFTALSSGASLHLLHDDIRRDVDRLWRYIQDNSITQASLTPALFQDCKNLAPLTVPLRLTFGADTLPPSLLRTMALLLPKGTIVTNEYGPTEITVAATRWESSTRFSGETVPIGRPITNKRIYILDRHRQPVPLGASGEIYIGGTGIARGYLNRPELTAEVFLPDPFSDEPGARMYKTGDCGRYLPDGNIVFLGRNDHQVKIRGFRIELGEIDSRLSDHPLVDKTIVIATGEGNSKRLVAYVVADHYDNLVSTLRSYLSSCLPEYMVPAAIVRMDSLPINSNGKIDRKTLPDPDSSAFARHDYEEPQGDVEIAVARIWAEVLNVDRISRNDNFFDLGGHSLLAVRLMNRLSAINLQLPLSTLFTSPSFSSFIECVHQYYSVKQEPLMDIVPVPRHEYMPISFAQQRLWFLAQLDGVSESYHIPMALRLTGCLDREAIQHALDTVFARHEALRTVFVAINGQPHVRVLPSEQGLPIIWKDLQGRPDTEAQLQHMSTQEATTSFDLTCGPLIRATMIQLDKDEHVFLITQHHIVSDGWSVGVLLNELSVLYEAYSLGYSSSLQPLGIQYPDYAAWQRHYLSGDRLEAQRSFWNITLADAPVLINLPTDRQRPPEQSTRGDHVQIHFDQQLTSALKGLCQEHGVTLFMVILAAWSAVLSRLSGQDDIVIGTPTANRNHRQIESLIGFFVNTLALRIDLSGDVTVRQLLERVRLCTIEAQAHQDIPFEQVVEIVQPVRSMSHTPLFQVMFGWNNNEDVGLNLPGLQVQDYKIGYNISKFDVDLQLQESDKEIVGSMVYSTALFDRETIERQIGYLQVMLQAMSENGAEMITKVDIVSRSERNLLLRTWNATHQEYPSHLCIHHLFEQQVERTPEATAVVFMDQSLTYRELNERANRLAHHLIGLGVRPETRVAICVDRSLAMIVGVLTILKSGGAYVPLDPAYASDRLRDILMDAMPTIVIADGSGQKVLGPEALNPMIMVDPNTLMVHAGEDLRSYDGENDKDSRALNPHVRELTSRNLSYIIYTSGSTGKPKGVLIEHQGVVNFICGRLKKFDIPSSSQVLQFTSLGFDNSVSEIFSTLAAGACLHLITSDTRLDRSQLCSYMESRSITYLSVPPAFLQDNNEFLVLKSMKTLITMGEALNTSVIPKIRKVVPNSSIINEYGPTEITVTACTWSCQQDCRESTAPIGRPTSNKKVYILDKHCNPVPLGVAGELYIGGVGVARGYLNRPELTEKVFLPDPFADEPGARMYKTGDLVRYLPDGNIVFLGRNDHQVKIRGFRIELGEIESRLLDHLLVDKTIVVATGEGNTKRLVAYVVADHHDSLVNTLRSYLLSCLPEYMVPAAIVRMDSLPINSNGKIDRKALPDPDSSAFARHDYEEPQGDVEIAVAQIWAEVLNVDRISRNDNFFALGGHSLLVVQLIERLRRIGFTIPIRTLFKNPTLHVLAQSIDLHLDTVAPDNLITSDTTTITSDMLPLISLTQDEIDHVISGTPGGVSNVQDIYALSPLQEGILFHHLLETQGDSYLLIVCMAFESRQLVDRYLDAVQQVVDRHDILRTAIVWNGMATPAQVVWRHAPLDVAELQLDIADGSITDQLMNRFDPRRNRIDVDQAPMMRFVISKDIDDRWVVVQLFHHLITDHSTLDVMHTEISTFMCGQGHTLSRPQQFRDFIAQVRSEHSHMDHEQFFTEMLADIDTPSLPFGLTAVHGLGDDVFSSSHRMFRQDLNDRIRHHARSLDISVATLCHLAWAMVISSTSGNDRVVFGTVLFGRMRSGSGIDGSMGLFINTLPIRIDIGGSVRQSVLAIHERLASLLDHEHASLNLAQQCSSVPQGTTLFNSILNYRHNTVSENDSQMFPGIEYLESKEVTNYPISLSVEDFGTSLGITSIVMSPLDPDRICGYMEQAMESLADALDRNVDSDLRRLEVLPTEEHDLLVRTWNATQQEYPSHLCIHHLFEHQVECTPDATAVVFMDQSLTYRELNERANSLAHHLIGLGVQPETRVAICVDRSLAMIVGVLAILKSGGAYVPLDPTYASERLCDTVTDADPSIVVVDGSGRMALGESLSSTTIVDLSDSLSEKHGVERQRDRQVNPKIDGLTSNHLAYIIYTSGSTGKPKGVMVEHQGVVNLVNTRVDVCGVTPSSRIAQFFSFGFDGCVPDIFMAICLGGSLHILQETIRSDPNQFWAYLQDHSITQALSAPAFFQSCQNLQPLSTDLTLITAGEAVTPALLRTLQALVPNGRVVNDYGPTETTVSVISWRCPRGFKEDIVPIGRPIANKKIYVLNERRQPVPLGATGELYIGGVGVARGYLNRPDLTAKAFLPDPFSDEPGARMYKTGDLVRYLPDGNIVFLGRNDHQVKIRGFRIELGEIDSRLSDHPLVDKTIVIATGEGNSKRLVAYVVANQHDDLVNTLRSYLLSCLPEYMVPAAIVRMDSLPITVNGKIDRKALPDPDSSAFARHDYEEPQGDVEIAVAQIWAEVLNIDRISRNDNFFDLGGHSLLAVRLMNRLSAINLQLPLSTLFTSPSFSSFIECVHQYYSVKQEPLMDIVPVPRHEYMPISFAQQRLWFLAQLDGVSESYHIPMALRLTGCLDREAIQHALDTVFARHEALRTVFVAINGQPHVRVLPSEQGLPIIWKDLQGRPDTEAQLQHMSTQEATTSFDLTCGPLIRATMIQLDKDEHVFLITQHHIVSDGWSVGVLLNELSVLYEAYSLGYSSSLQPLGIQYPDYAAWQRHYLSGDRLEAQRSFWNITLADAPVLINLPTDRQRPPEQSTRGDHVQIHFDQQLTSALKGLCQEHGVTLFMVILAAWSAVLSRLSGQDDIVIGTPTANRNHRQIESLIGFFVNTLALRIDLSGDVTVRQLLERVRLCTIEAQAHQDIPFEQVVEIVQPVRSMSHTPLFQVMFGWNNNEDVGLNLPGLQVQDYKIGYNISKFDVDLQLQESDKEIVGSMVYSTALFDRETIERQIGYLQAMLQAISRDTREAITKADIVSGQERDMLLRTWNATEQEYPSHLCIHHLFEQQVERTPEATAVVFEDQSLTYRELNERANRLAHHLIGLGVRPETRVAICVDRSLAMIVGVYAIMKSGGAYVPLDPSYASDRLINILEDCASTIVLADTVGRDTLSEINVRRFRAEAQEHTDSTIMIDPNDLFSSPDTNPIVPGLTSNNLSYLIYTSGSTGKPKGVMIEHQGVVNHTMARLQESGMDQFSRGLQFSSLSFDYSALEIYTALSSGATLHVLADEIRHDSKLLWDYLEQNSITHASMTPALLRDNKGLQPLTTPLKFSIGGENIPPSLFRSLLHLLPEGSQIIHEYGPTETTIVTITWKFFENFDGDIMPIGRPLSNKKVYVLNEHLQLAPVGATGELYIGGVGVARGYLNRPDLTAKAFLPDPFSDEPGARMYKTGDLVQYLPDGNIVFLGRNDHQVKIRGFRIELGEIESRLSEHSLVDETTVIATGEGNSKRLVAYVVADQNDGLVNTLRSYLSSCLPDYMVPAAIVRMDSFPLNSNGKIDHKALPDPDSSAFALQDYEEPQGDVEIAVAQIWADLLNIDRIGRNDNFFALGGHSLLVVQLIERLRLIGLSIPIRYLFKNPTLRILAQSADRNLDTAAPDNLITSDTTTITPDMLPLVNLTQNEIDHVISIVPGGVSNIQDIYALSPSQEGILFHHRLETQGDPYLLITGSIFESRQLLDGFLDALQQVADRHDILRTAVIWNGMTTPVQVVTRHASIDVTELQLDVADGPIKNQLMNRYDPKYHRIDLHQAPMMKFAISKDIDDRWVLVHLFHHLIMDHSTLDVMLNEISAFMHGRGNTLGQPQQFRNLIAQIQSEHNRIDHEGFFTKMLADIDTPSLPFGLTDVHGHGKNSSSSRRMFRQDLNDRVRHHARSLDVSVATLCHLAWAIVISRASGEDQAVFGTVLFGRMRSGSGADSTMGLFINTLPIRVDINGGIRESVLAVHERLASLLDHEHASLSLAQQCSSVPQGTPLFNSILNYRHNTVSENDSQMFPGIEYLESKEVTNYPISLSVEDFGTSLGITSIVVSPLDPDRICGYMEQAMESLADALDRNVDSDLRRLEVLPTEEHDLLVRTWNATQQEYPSHLCIHHLFEHQVECTPDATAVVFMDQSLTYRELNERANSLAHHLIGLGVQPETRVAICVDRSLAMIVGVLAILKSGGAYVPLDPTYASERLCDTVTDADPSIVVVDGSGRMALGESLSSATVVDLSDSLSEKHGVERQHDSQVNPKIDGLTSNHLAYIIYTSGSTGKPKGVMVEHQGVVNLVRTRKDVYGITSSSRIAQFFAFGFDGCALDIFMTICLGGSLHILQETTRSDLIRLWSYFEVHSITQAILAPAILQSCKDLQPLSTDLTLITAGEALSAGLLRTLQALVPKCRIVNDYGPTETTVSAIAWRCPQGFSGDIVPIGRPIANKKVYVLDEHLQLVPVGVTGELYIGGVGVARGYLNRPELTEKVFLPDPFADEPGARMYKTGDLVRYLPDGNIVFLGRNDHQVKIRGFRIELGEIESRLLDHLLVDKTIVVATGEGNTKRLVAYVVADHHDSLVNTLRSYLLSCLPEYMVPAAIVRMDSLPITANGKIDRKALPDPDSSAFARHDYEEPQGDVEIAVAQIWAEVLNVDRISRNDNFFALGGHSLLVVQLIERLRRIGFTIPIRTLFKNPTLHVLAQSIDLHLDTAAPENSITSDTTTITSDMLPLISLTQDEIDHVISGTPGGVSNVQDIYALSPLQEGILFHHLLETQGDSYLLIVCMAFESRQLVDRYLDAVQQVVDRHDILRTAIVWNGVTKPAQVVWRHAPLDVTELQLDIADGSITDQLMNRFDPRRNRIDVDQAPMMRFVISKDIDDRWVVVQLFHHLIMDHSTLDVMHTEISTFMCGQGHTLSRPQQFRDFIAQVRSEHSHMDHEEYFTEMLADIDTPSLPFGLTAVHGLGDDVFSSSHRMFRQGLNDRIRHHARSLDISVATLCHLAWAMVISSTSGNDRVVFGTVLFGRMRSGSGIDGSMGLFINTLPIRIDIGGSVRQSVLAIHERLASLLDHENASLNLAQQCSSVPQGTPLFNSILNYRHHRASISEDASTTYSGIEHIESRERTSYPIALSVEDFGTSLGITSDVVSSLDPTRICGYMEQAMESLADALDRNVDSDLRRLEVLPTEEHDLLVRTWNATQQEYPSHLCIHHLFEHQVECTPDATAVVFMDQSLTYRELNERANSLAHHLIGLGVQPETRVAICVDRSLAMIVGVLAILKSGGAYVPLDPTYASERLCDTLTDADPSIVVVDGSGRMALGESLSSTTIVDLSDSLSEKHGVERQHDRQVNPKIDGLTSSNLAYIIYTSGSTGKPKGVMVEHQGVVNLVRTRVDVYGVTSSSQIVQFFSFGFDGSTMDILTTMSAGAILHILPDTIRYDQNLLWKYLDDHRITQALLPPAILQGSRNLPMLSTPLTLAIGGEALPSTLIRSIQPLIPNGRIVNDYGPTEATISSVLWQCPPNFSGDVVSIGRPIANKKVYVLNEHHQLVPVGTTGELYIGGVGVARGYLNRPELTEKVFLPDPFSDEPEARMYKTGDLVRYLPDGNIVFLGRNDHQVKIRGFRIELGEIESRLSDHPLVDKTIVVATGEGNTKRLVAYVVADHHDSLVNTLRSYLSSCLPDYMVPAAIVRMDSLPLNSNGKFDRKALPKPDSNSFAHDDYEGPQGDVEISVAQIWTLLLNIDSIGRNDNFFALGGHSLLAVKLVSQIQAVLGFKLSLVNVFQAPTIAQLASLVSSSNNQEAEFNVLLPIKKHGSRAPLFCIHPGIGLSWDYSRLVKHLDVEQPVYGLQIRGFFDADQPAETLDEMALDYIDQIRMTQPHGPYRLLGWSFGGIVAHTMASHLEQQGERVVLLGIMDAFPTMTPLMMQIAAEESMEDYGPEFFWKLLNGGDADDRMTEQELAFWKRAPEIEPWVTRLRKNHSTPSYCGDVILFRAMIQQDLRVPLVTALDWEPYVQGEIKVHDIRCKHDDMRESGPIAEIGSILDQRLGEIHAYDVKEE